MSGPFMIFFNMTYGGYTWETYAQINQRVNDVGSGLMHLNERILGNSQLNRWSVGIWSQGRPEWFITEMSCNFHNLVSIALYDTLGPDAIEYICQHSEIKVVVCSIKNIIQMMKIADNLPELKAIVSMDSLRDSATAPGSGDNNSADRLRSWGNEKGIKILDFDEIEALGKMFPRKHTPPHADEVASICYTSGTTGQPKGAMLTHKNFIASIGTNRESMHINADDVLISYLPLAHIMGRMVDTNATFAGCKVGYFRGDVALLMEDVAELKPTYFPTVPRLLNRIYAKIVAATIEAPGVAGVLARRAVADKLVNLEAGKGVHHPVWDPLVFDKVKMALGGRVQVLLTGSAPISKEVLSFLRVALACVVTEGYGATEGMAVGTITMADFPSILFFSEYIPGHVGCPRPGIELKLVDVPEMNYLTTDRPYPRGEIRIRGATVFKGYYKDEKNTQETVDPEGWLATGDIGFMDDRGCLTIVDRKKNIFKLAQGEYIAPEKIENILTARCNLVMQIYVHGDSLESTLVAVSVPDPETFVPFANTITGAAIALNDQEGIARLCEHPQVKSAYLKELEKAGKAGGFRGFEFVKRLHLTTDAFSVDNELLTPTFKVRRPQVRDKFKDVIQAMYEEMRNEVPAAKL
ncbi:hypothetical protein BC939DRAFT_478206 [Gamsiella multidivaricata]|uniref:uncharacterized protein n=1 Tax=Gamsiella multidivaricata TaxID=101098 RepID=UPI00221FFEC2|nr:uncharacterized protein BC939DRAFT_478206 [Gamsiella multidivaricata]KAI7821756.1 hypothetical protein BC939DRAFT_478206 [Gamsiella multidivaricata]